MNDIYDTHELNINDPKPPISQNTLETSSEQYLDFTITECKNMLKNIKGTNIFDEMTVDEDDFMENCEDFSQTSESLIHNLI